MLSGVYCHKLAYLWEDTAAAMGLSSAYSPSTNGGLWEPQAARAVMVYPRDLTTRGLTSLIFLGGA